MISHTVLLDYSLHPGWMAQFIKGMQAGKAVARQCLECHRTSFPPHRTCACGATQAAWVVLPGTATIQFRATGSDGDFALVHFDGADTSAVVRLHGIAPDQTRGRCIAADDAVPQMILGPLEGDSP